jgi:hypothetical protein
MTASRQGDLFSTDPRSDPVGDDAPPRTYGADPDAVRAELHRILAEARAARQLPWEPKRAAFYRTVFPQMANWLPDDEAAQLRFDFAAELERLAAA